VASLDFLGPVSGRLKAGLYRAAALYALTSRGEGLPATALEAMWCGRPVVLTRACNLPEVEEAGAGVLTEERPDAIARALLDVLRDPQRADEMGRRGRRLVERRFTWGAVGRQTAELLERISVEAGGVS